MSEKMRLRVEHTSNGTSLLYDQAGVLIASVWAGDRPAEYIVAAVNAYDPDVMLESTSQWVEMRPGHYRDMSTIEWWSIITNSDGKAYGVAFGITYDRDLVVRLEGAKAVPFLRYMAREMGDAFPAALKEMLS